jgi:hypothetical protein
MLTAAVALPMPPALARLSRGHDLEIHRPGNCRQELAN